MKLHCFSYSNVDWTTCQTCTMLTAKLLPKHVMHHWFCFTKVSRGWVKIRILDYFKFSQVDQFQHYFFHQFHNPNTIKSYKILQKLSPKHAAHGVVQSPYPIYRHGKACLSKQLPWRAAPDPRLARGRSRVRAPGPAGTLRTLFFSTLPSFLLREIVLFPPSPPNPRKC